MCKLHIAKTVNSTPCYKYGRTITSSTKDCFVSNLPDLSQFLSISNSSEQLDDVTETTDSLFSSTLDTVAPLRLRKIINSSLSLEYVPKTFNLAVIKPLIKKTQLEPKDLVNYRPISNLPFLSKILEKVVSSQLYSFLEKNGICEDFQSGFRPYHSTETALIRVTNDLLLSSDRGCISLLVLLDLSAAFDTIDHNILLNRLQNFVGISGSALAWFKSYLSDRHQFLAVNDEVSYRSQVQYGVPQGSVLGPLLFTLYMLPLGDIIRRHGVSFHCYADDTQLYISSRPGETHQIEKLTECIVDIKNWMTSNFLLLNSEKTEVLIIGPINPTCNNLEHYLTLDGCSVNFSSSSVRNLGVLFDSNLSFESHVSNICKTAFFHLKNISKLRPCHGSARLSPPSITTIRIT